MMTTNNLISNTDKDFKYKLFIGFCICIHLAITLFAICTHITTLVLFNICSIVCYICCMFLIKRNKKLIFYVGFAEIIMHSFLSVLLIGNSFGFSLYFVAIIPMTFHLLNAVESKRCLINSLIISCISFVLYATCYIISNINQPIYTSDILTTLRPYVYLTNMFITFCTIITFTVLFLREIQHAYSNLCDKNNELDNLANTDPLTGLYNRRTMTTHVQNMYEDYRKYSNPFSLIVCDIDDFKIINDTYGHDFGDVVLIEISNILSTLTRGLDFVCRWGGEEFIIFLRNTDKDVAITIAERIRKQIEATEFKYNDKIIHITMTFGVSCVTETDDYEKLFHLTDSRMYEGKKSGKNKVV